MRGEEDDPIHEKTMEEIDNAKALLGNKDSDIYKRREQDTVVAIDRNALIDAEEFVFPSIPEITQKMIVYQNR